MSGWGQGEGVSCPALLVNQRPPSLIQAAAPGDFWAASLSERMAIYLFSGDPCEWGAHGWGGDRGTCIALMNASTVTSGML